MKPGIDQQLMALTGVLATKIAPAIPEESYAVGDAKMAAALALMLAQEVDRRADTLWRENRAMRALFAEGARHDLPETLVARLLDAGKGTDASLRISVLEEGHADLSILLIALQEALESSDDAWAVALNAQIWDFLEKAAEDRMLVMPAL